MRVVIDFVPNHTSDRHPWFVEARASRDNPRRDWYVWRDGDGRGADGEPPNDWVSNFGAVGPAWTWDDATGQWYLHSFLPEQPDLNWDEPEVEAALHEAMRFWLDRGVDGFRIDVAHAIAKDPELRSNAGSDRVHHEDWQPTIHERFQRMRAMVDEYDDRMLVGEVYLLDLDRVVAYVNSGRELHLAHNFTFVKLPWDAAAFRANIDGWEAAASDVAWPAWFLSNHDHPRVASRFDDGGLGQARARAVLLLLYALRGTPFIFQGEELGLPDAEIPADRIVDVDGRDPERAPIPWTPNAPGYGFTTADRAWLPFIDDAATLNAATQAEDPHSTLNLTKALADLRITGDQKMVDGGPGIVAWTRDDTYFVAVNFTDQALPLKADGALVISSDPAREAVSASLAPSEALILRLRG
jgi:alpha-glucosidase